MAGERSKRLRTRIQRALKDDAGEDSGQQEFIYDTLNRIQNRICQDATAVQTKETISVVASTELYNYPSGFIGIVSVQAPTSSTLVEINIEELTKLKSASTSAYTTGSPFYFYRWNRQIGFVTSSGSAPTEASTIYVYGYRLPKDDGSEDISDSIDPIVHRRWDTCLFYGVMAEISGEPNWWKLYDMEFENQRKFETAEKSIVYSIPSNTDYE